jgi:hypothetical protein
MNVSDLPLPPTTLRVEHSTAREINARIENETEENVVRVGARGPAAIERRLHQLDDEWDIERTLEVNASTVTLVTLALGLTVHRRWLAFPAVVAAFLLQHALQGWCPPVPFLRRMGVRTEREINLERTALRILRGDFQAWTHDPREAFAQARNT